ncbi:MAG: transcriptional repressor [Candidatus Margulisiibacteriota bacterium]|nr:MAG: hypothetical protein A2X43_08135 [Candidatus Margulisbacteria bacterium GWD2_39_127]OGI01655.1 MAG: hypothetical protein A2X42_04845 [Candidatus Margulisbacteria bacterium GWF2_38_17]OGI05870.1 MAG: hypothetical protein A2X41_04530 [Candidatus Margulisbacteria bacterium GWE2_39_32]PZM83864.1 MAG: transcriptional repressor [Candidatus Margulisiibacteriota bacterium]HAR63620.1 transcriptional repressor [Candidatus Margulisiibacteriota bacterium]
MEIRESIIRSLKQHSLKVTPQRIAIMEYLSGTKAHPTAENIRAALEKTFPSLSFATIYNTLEMLVETKLVSRLKISEESRINYDFFTDPHHHFYCRICGKVLDVHISCDVARKREVDGHCIEEVHGYFKGVCSQCR